MRHTLPSPRSYLSLDWLHPRYGVICNLRMIARIMALSVCGSRGWVGWQRAIPISYKFAGSGFWVLGSKPLPRGQVNSMEYMGSVGPNEEARLCFLKTMVRIVVSGFFRQRFSERSRSFSLCICEDLCVVDVLLWWNTCVKSRARWGIWWFFFGLSLAVIHVVFVRVVDSHWCTVGSIRKFIWTINDCCVWKLCMYVSGLWSR